MSEVFTVCNQLGQFWGKKKRWVDGRTARRILTSKHQDEAVNLLVELSSKDIELRGEVIAIELDERGVPRVTPSEHLLEDPDDVRATDADEGESEESGDDAGVGEQTSATDVAGEDAPQDGSFDQPQATEETEASDQASSEPPAENQFVEEVSVEETSNPA